jgi:hypothetical protein
MCGLNMAHKNKFGGKVTVVCTAFPTAVERTRSVLVLGGGPVAIGEYIIVENAVWKELTLVW